MKSLLSSVLLLALLPFCTFAQLTDHFSDNDFSANPTWQGDTAAWTVSGGQLRSVAGSGATDLYVTTPSELSTDAQWEFYVKLSFNPSSSNYADIFLTSDQANLKSSLNGYFVRIGGARDEICLYKKSGTANTKLIDGKDKVTNYSTNTLKIKVIRTEANQWTLQRDTTGTGSYFVTEGMATDATFTTGAYFGVFIKSTASNLGKHYFDDFSVQPIDRKPPMVDSVQVVAANTLSVWFSEPVSAGSVQTLTNFVVNNQAGNPASVALPADGKQATLTFGNNFTGNLPYELTVSDVEDLNGNHMPEPQRFRFTYEPPFEPQYRDIVINEIVADPTPVVDLPDQEFVELYNNMNHAINLNGYTFTDGSSTAKFSNVTLPPHGYLIVCHASHAALFSSFGAVAGLSNFPSLNNSGETLTLKNAAGMVIDRLMYALSWYGDAMKDDGGWSLEQINPQTLCSQAGNWLVSTNASGGTPGKPNSVLSNQTDLTPPTLLETKVLAPNQLQLTFNETMDSLQLQRADYQLNNDLQVTQVKAIAPEYVSVQLTLNAEMTAGNVYQLTVPDLPDCPGNRLKRQTVFVGTGATLQFNQLLITEIMADETPVVGLPEAEYLELYNPTGLILSLKSVTLTDATGTATLPDHAIFPGEYVLLSSSGNVAKLSAYGKVISVSGFPALNNSGELLTLRNPQGALIFSVDYSPEWYGDSKKADGGWSLEMIDINNPCGETGNWTASEGSSSGTPGKVNSVNASKPDGTPPVLVGVEVQDDQHIAAIFNEKLDSVSASNITGYTLQNNAVETATVESPQNKQVKLTLTQPLLPKKLYTLLVTLVADCAGNRSGVPSSITFALPEPDDSLDVVLNEILFNPRTGGVDFVEIYNRSDKYIDLHGWRLANEKDTAEITDKAIIAPTKYIVFTTDKLVLQNHYPKLKTENVLVLKSLPSFPDEAGTVKLINERKQLVDQFDYDEDFHFALLDDVSGVSLERISASAFGNVRANWHSAAATEGYATPGYRNSQQTGLERAKASFTIMPQVFTPDNDGWDDFTTFQYRFEKAGTVANITVYDATGREIKRVARNMTLATEGFFQWDGVNETGEKVRVGRYVVQFHIFDLTGRQQTFRESVVVGAKF